MEENQNQPNRKVVKKSDIILLGTILVFFLCVLGFMGWKKSQPGSNYAVLTLNGEFLEGFKLSQHQAHSIQDLQEEYGIPGKLEFNEGAVRFIEVDCPDKICEMAGYVKNELDTAVCLPNRVALQVYTPEDYQALMERLNGE